MDIANHLKDLKPDLEMMYIEQDMPRVSLQVEPSPEMEALYPTPPSFEEQIAEFVSVFRFQSTRMTLPPRSNFWATVSACVRWGLCPPFSKDNRSQLGTRASISSNSSGST